MASESTWTEILTPAELTEIDAALRVALNKSADILEVGRDDFPLPTLATRLATIEDELINGRGFVRLRGIYRGSYSQHEMEMLYWGIGQHLGTPWAQNKHGHVLGDVTDQSKAHNDPTSRGAVVTYVYDNNSNVVQTTQYDATLTTPRTGASSQRTMTS